MNWSLAPVQTAKTAARRVSGRGREGIRASTTVNSSNGGEFLVSSLTIHLDSPSAALGECWRRDEVQREGSKPTDESEYASRCGIVLPNEDLLRVENADCHPEDMTLNPLTEPLLDATPREPYRTFTDGDGRDWMVWRLAEDYVEELREASSLRRAWLIFLGPNGETRRLAPVPAKWRKMKDGQLAALARGAKPFTPREPR